MEDQNPTEFVAAEGTLRVRLKRTGPGYGWFVLERLVVWQRADDPSVTRDEWEHVFRSDLLALRDEIQEERARVKAREALAVAVAVAKEWSG